MVLSKIANHQEPKNNKNVSKSTILYLYQVQKTRISCGTTFYIFPKNLNHLEPLKVQFWYLHIVSFFLCLLWEYVVWFLFLVPKLVPKVLERKLSTPSDLTLAGCCSGARYAGLNSERKKSRTRYEQYWKSFFPKYDLSPLTLLSVGVLTTATLSCLRRIVEIALVLIWNVHIAAKISAHWIFVKIGKVETYLEVEHFPFCNWSSKTPTKRRTRVTDSWAGRKWVRKW